MLRKSKQQILKTNIRNNLALKNEYKNLIIKSIIHNRNINFKYRILANFSKNINANNNKKICNLSGRHRGVDTKLNLSRHNLNYFSKLGILQNFKIKSW